MSDSIEYQLHVMAAYVLRATEALERIADCLDDVNHDGHVAVKGLVVTREDRP